MPQIHILDEATINQIAAGEVVERPSAVVKELIENAMDAGATAITAEIKEGGLSFIRITDNGAGIAREDIPLAFLRHATSKIKTAQDLLSVVSLGFRGEALSSISSVAQVELITKNPSSLNGYRYLIEGGEEKSFEDIGCPGGTTIIIRNLFFNTPARRKFLKSPTTEGGYISDLMERLMVSHPEVSFKYIVNNQVKLQSAGNNNSKDILYNVYGRDVAKELLPLEFKTQNFKISGYIGKPIINRGNRNYENYFINGRYIKSNVITRAIEEAYKPFMMQHKYPFTSLYLEINPELIDVNVHPQKMEIRLKNGEEVYQFIMEAIRSTLSGKELIPKVILTPQQEEVKKPDIIPEPFEQNRRKEFQNTQGSFNNYKDFLPRQKDFSKDNQRSFQNHSQKSQYTYVNNPLVEHTVQEKLEESKAFYQSEQRNKKEDQHSGTEHISVGIKERADITKSSVAEQGMIAENSDITKPSSDAEQGMIAEHSDITKLSSEEKQVTEQSDMVQSTLAAQSVLTEKSSLSSAQTPSEERQVITIKEQMNLFEKDSQENPQFLSKQALEEHRIIGQVFSTYWLVEYKKELYIIDQHAAHEKVLYERMIAGAKSKGFHSQQLLPPIVLSLTLREQQVLQKHEEALQCLGYEIEHFGGNEFSVRAVPADLYGISEKGLLLEFIDELSEDTTIAVSDNNTILEKIASMSCKAAVKANHSFSTQEAFELIKELLTLDNPYHCPHGRPVIVSMSQSELERKFKRIL